VDFTQLKYEVIYCGWYESLTDTSIRGDKNKNVQIAGIVAQPLSYLTLSLQSTLEFTTNSGENGKVVSPAAWIFHKGLTFPKRKSSLKILKDLYGIWYVVTQLGEFSNGTLFEFQRLASRHLKWYESFQKNLLNWIDKASPGDWREQLILNT
jgi:hypothetical protein